MIRHSIGLSLLLVLAGLAASCALSSESTSLTRFEYDLKESSPLTSVVWTGDGKYIVASSMFSNEIPVWDANTRKRIKVFERDGIGHTQRELSTDPAGRYVAWCDGIRGEMRVYSTATWSLAQTLPRATDTGCRTSAFSSDGEEFAVLGYSLSVYSTRDWRLLKQTDIKHEISKGADTLIRTVAYLPNSHTIVLGGDDVDIAAPYYRPVGHVFFIAADSTVPNRGFAAYNYIPDQIVPSPNLISLAISPDGQTIATGTGTGSGFNERHLITASVHILDVKSGKLLAAPLDDKGFSSQDGLAFTADGRYLLVGHGGYYVKHVVHLIDTHSYAVVGSVKAGNTIWGLAAKPDGKQFAVSAGATISVWSLLNRH